MDLQKSVAAQIVTGLAFVHLSSASALTLTEGIGGQRIFRGEPVKLEAIP